MLNRTVSNHRPNGVKSRSSLFWTSDELRQVKSSATLSVDLWPSTLMIVQNTISSYFDKVDIHAKKRWMKNPETAYQQHQRHLGRLPSLPVSYPAYNILTGTEQQKQNPGLTAILKLTSMTWVAHTHFGSCWSTKTSCLCEHEHPWHPTSRCSRLILGHFSIQRNRFFNVSNQTSTKAHLSSAACIKSAPYSFGN